MTPSTSRPRTAGIAAAGFLAVVAVAAVQQVVRHDPGAPLVAALPFVTAAAVVVVVGWTGAGERGGRAWLTALACGQVALAVLAVARFLVALPVGIGEPSGFYRVKLLVTTPLGDHNTVGGLLLVGVVATVVLAVDDRRWWAGVAITTAGTVATLSRGAAAVLLAVGFGSLVVRARREVAVGVLVAGAVATAGVTLAATVLDASPPPGAEVPEGPIGTSIVGRIDLAARGFETAASEPVLGVGLGSFVEAAHDLPVPNHHAHNAVAHLGAEAGAVGVVVAVGLPLLLAVRGLRLPRGWRRDLVLLGGAGLVAHAQVDILAGLVGYEVLLAVLLGLASTAATSAPGARQGDG